ncbi:MAG: FHA domain-containing protein [Kofleriaceae bacterium]
MAKRSGSDAKGRAPQPTTPPVPAVLVPPDGPAQMKTKTLPDSFRGAFFDGIETTTVLKVYDTDLKFELDRKRRSFTLGSAPERDIAIRDEYVSNLHCLIERRGNGLRVYDQDSYNGTFFDGRRVSVFDPRPGDTFVAGRVRLLLLNDEMQAAYPSLAEILGSEDEGTVRRSSTNSPCDVIVAATGGANILITGEPGCEQRRLAEAIHSISLRRDHELVVMEAEPTDRAQQRALIDRASRSTVVVSIGPKDPVMDATFVSMLFSPSYHIRVVAIAPTVAKTKDVLGEMYVSTMQRIALAPLAQRQGAVPRLLDRMFADRGSKLRVSDLTPANQAALQSHSWPDNFAGLRLAAERLIAIARDGSLLKASKALGVSTSTLHYWFTQLSLSLPLASRA